MNISLINFYKDKDGKVKYKLDKSLQKYNLTLDLIKEGINSDLRILEKVSDIISKNIVEPLETELEKDIATLYCSNYGGSLCTGFKVNKYILRKDRMDELIEFSSTEEFVEAIFAIESYIMRKMCTSIIDKKDNINVFKITAIKTLRGGTLLNVSSDFNNDLFKTEFISKNYWRENDKDYLIHEYRPAFRLLLIDLKEYCDYLLSFVSDIKLFNKMRNPEIFSLEFSLNNERSIEVNPEFIEVLSHFLADDQIDYFISELFCLFLEIDEEVQYILRNLKYVEVKEGAYNDCNY